MLTGSVIVLASFVYVGLLFAIAYYGDKRADAGRSIVAHATLGRADVGIVGRDGRSRLQRAALAPVHERVVRLAGCAVLVIPAPAVATPARRRLRLFGSVAQAGNHP